jgi:UDP-N-acetylmuramyl tripeptide synthase
MEAFKTAQSLEPFAEREKISGFILLVGAGPEIIPAGEDREAAIEQAVELINQRDTVVFLSKLQSRFGKTLVTKDQLIFTRK